MKPVRDDFPILEKSIYLDSASTSLTPEPVVQAIIKYYREYNANTGRGVYRLAQMAGQRYRDAHKKVAGFIGAEEVIFTKNATESINIVARGMKWKRGDRIVTSLIEHHSNLLPWMRLRDSGIELEIVKPDIKGSLEISDFERAISKGSKLVALTQVSNVLGAILPVKEISEICHDSGALILVDAAQSAPHMPIDVKELGCDFLCFSGHKMLGPKGTGVLWAKGMPTEKIEPLTLGGGTVEDVSTESYLLKNGYERFEAGTQDIPGGIGLGVAVDYLEGIGMEEISAHEKMLTNKMLKGLMEIEGVEVYGPKEAKDRAGLASFNISGLDPHEVALMLDEASDIMVRSGHHCCIPLMKHLGLDKGTVRASLYLYNTEEEIEKFLSTIEEIARAA